MSATKHVPGMPGRYWSEVQWRVIVQHAKAERRHRSAHRQLPGQPRSSLALNVANEYASELRRYAHAAITQATGSAP